MQGGPQHGPVMVINQGSKRETGREAQLGNIAAGKAIADIIRTTLGPRSMLKMLLDDKVPCGNRSPFFARVPWWTVLESLICAVLGSRVPS